jgi:hypothetical protein
MFCVMCQQVKAEAGSLLPGKMQKVCLSCFRQAGSKISSQLPGRLPDPNAVATEMRQKAEAQAAEQRMRLSAMQADVQAQALAKLAEKVPANLQNDLAGHLNSISDGTSNTVKSIVDGTSNTVRNAIVDGTSNRVGNAVNRLNNLKSRFGG